MNIHATIMLYVMDVTALWVKGVLLTQELDKPEWFQRTVYGQARQLLSLTTTGKEFPKTLSFKFGDYLDNRQMEIFQCLQVYNVQFYMFG